jgi:bifunctional non-homologous end joining protein LigD
VALDEYRRKRDLTKSPEPGGDQAKSRRERKGKALYFCVQKHLASHLHYDFRLEHDGVLLSWAVPKGPSLDPATKRLAMKVEDHPFDYGEFEGVIPEGYGAGIVMLWDKGTWTPETGDIEAALKKGDLKFTLDGYKLKGSWVLVRTKGGYASGRWGASGKDNTWLLIKHRDDWSGELDITDFAPLSVKSGGDFEDILGDKTPAIWHSHRPAKSGDAGTMFARIIERAAALKGSVGSGGSKSSGSKGSTNSKGSKGSGSGSQGSKGSGSRSSKAPRGSKGSVASKRGSKA